MCFHSRHHLTRAERLCNVIVGAETKTANLIDIILLCGDHDDRGVLCLPDFSAYLKSIHPRQHEIQDKEIKLLRDRPLQSGLSVIFYLNLEAGQFQIVLFEFRNTLLIFYDQNFTHIQFLLLWVLSITTRIVFSSVSSAHPALR